MAAAMGGGIRTGLEDSSMHLDADKRIPAKNKDWIKRAVEAAIRNGREIATPNDVRQWLDLRKS